MSRKMFSFRLPEDLMSQLRQRAESEGTSLTELVCRLLRQGVDQSVDSRISTLEEEIQELKQLKHAALNGMNAALGYHWYPPTVTAVVPTDLKTQMKQLQQEMCQLKEQLSKQGLNSTGSSTTN